MHGSWVAWSELFEVAVEQKDIILGTEKVEVTQLDGSKIEVEQSRYNDRLKILSLYSCIGNDGRETLRNRGFNRNNADAKFKDAWDLLIKQYCREDSVYVKTQKLAHIKQGVTEDNRDYLARVEKTEQGSEHEP